MIWPELAAKNLMGLYDEVICQGKERLTFFKNPEYLHVTLFVIASLKAKYNPRYAIRKFHEMAPPCIGPLSVLFHFQNFGLLLTKESCSNSTILFDCWKMLREFKTFELEYLRH